MIWSKFIRPTRPAVVDVDALVAEGVAQAKAGRMPEAIRLLKEAAATAPLHAQAHVQLGVVLARSGDHAAALPLLHRGVELDPQQALAHMSLANVCKLSGDHEAALQHYRAAVDRDPTLLAAWSNMLRPMMDVHDWHGVDRAMRQISGQRDRLGQSWAKFISPMDSLLLPLAPAERREVAEYHAAALQPQTSSPHPQAVAERRLRIGYFSRDFRNHAVGQLVTTLLGQHDRERFEVLAYSYGKNDGSSYRKRAERLADRFIDLSGVGPGQDWRQIRADGVDILVDLGGYTTQHRLATLARRPAPVQVHYLGYPATLGAGLADYYLTDRMASPAGQDTQFAEALVRLRGCFMPSDPDQPFVDLPAARSKWGLPATGVVFCAFHQSAKIHPAVMSAWMAILRAVPESLLWLKVAPGEGPERLRRAAIDASVDPQRLLFAGNVVDKRSHVSRMASADLFLDTFERYNGHSTVNEALWAGLPVVSLAGDSFASRVAASLLHHAGAPDLIASDVDDYVAMAVRLAQDPEAVRNLRERLRSARDTAPLFDHASTVREIESAYQAIWERHRAGLPPSAIDL